MFQLVWNDADPTSETMASKVVKANYASYEDAMAQAEVDLAIGKRIVGIAENDELVWVADDHSEKKNNKLEKVTLGNGRTSWNFKE